jgi:hypothetical protein
MSKRGAEEERQRAKDKDETSCCDDEQRVNSAKGEILLSNLDWVGYQGKGEEKESPNTEVRPPPPP